MTVKHGRAEKTHQAIAKGGRNVEWNHVGSALYRVANHTTLAHLNLPLTKGRRLAKRNSRKNRDTPPSENPEVPFFPWHRTLHGLTKLAVEEAGFVAACIKIYIFLIDQLIAVDPVQLRIVPHGVVPPIKDRVLRQVIDRVAVAASNMTLNRTTGDVVNVPVSFQGVEGQEEV